MLASISRQRESRHLTELYVNRPFERVGMLEWEKFDEIVRPGHAHGVEVLKAGPAVTAAPA